MHSGSHERAILFARAFRNDNDCKFLSEVLAFLDFGANAFVGERDLRNQNHIRAACHAGVKGNPAGVTPHDFQDHDAVVTFSGGVQPVERIGRAGHGGIKSEREQRSFQIVVYGLGHTHYRNPIFKELLRDAQRAVAADGDEGTQIQRVHTGFYSLK